MGARLDQGNTLGKRSDTEKEPEKAQGNIRDVAGKYHDDRLYRPKKDQYFHIQIEKLFFRTPFVKAAASSRN